jgi:Uma2 family endonuclease
MSVAAVPEFLTTEEFLELLREEPENETWELVGGQLRKRPMTTRSRKHALAYSFVNRTLGNWLDSQPKVVGEIAGAEVRCRLRAKPETIVGIDVAYFAGDDFDDNVSYYDGPPVLAVEILSPTDTHEAVVEKTLLYLECGVKQVWIVDPDLQTVTVHRPAREPQFFTLSDTLTAEPELPGFSCLVRSLFGR